MLENNVLGPTAFCTITPIFRSEGKFENIFMQPKDK